jgi:2-polyprenyl-3-methyl-5-hydroxy-6-metoxy-1,4-benzoquinol methylase
MSKYNFDLDLDSRNSLSLILKRVKPNSTVLEFGPANGRMTKYLKEEMGCTVYTVELDPEAAKDAAKYSEKIIVGNIEDYEWLEEYKDVSFDYIVFADVLEHLYYPQKVLEKAKELLNYEGSIIFSIPNIAHNVIIMELLENQFTYHDVGLLDNTHIRFFTKKSLDKLVEEIGLHKVYESAVLVSPLQTEFHKNYDDFDDGISEYLKSRKYAEVYQYIYELKLVPEKLELDLEEYMSLKLYYDDGMGFNEESVVGTDVSKNDKKVVFDLSSLPRKVRRLRIDPTEQAIKLKIDHIKVDGQEVVFTHNGIDDEAHILFLHHDPQIFIDLKNESFVSSVEMVVDTFETINIKNEKIKQKDNEIKELEQKLLEKNQQLQQKDQLIQNQQQQIDQLQELAQSMRIKNRIKKLFSFGKK